MIHRDYTEAFQIEGMGEEAVSASGDSGAVVLTDEPSGSSNEMVGLLFGSGKSAGEQTQALATPIQQVIGAFPALKLTHRDRRPARPRQAGSRGRALARCAPCPRGAARGRSPLLTRLQSELTATPAGRHYSLLIQRHFAEGQRLVGQNRRVAVAWHRNGGPSIARSVLQMSKSADEILPREVDGRPLADCLARIGRTFARHGSAELAADIAAWGPPLAALAGLNRAQAIEALSQMRVP